MGLFSRLGRALARRVAYARYFLFARRDSRRNLSAISGRNILVLCYGNIYRSPFVGRQLADFFAGTEWHVRSAGFHDKENRSCDREFVKLAAKLGIDLQAHGSRQVAEEDLEWADLIVIMDGRNRLMLHEMSTQVGGKVVWIGAWLAGLRADVVDPYGMSQDRIESTVTRLFQSTNALAQELLSVPP